MFHTWWHSNKVKLWINHIINEVRRGPALCPTLDTRRNYQFCPKDCNKYQAIQVSKKTRPHWLWLESCAYTWQRLCTRPEEQGFPQLRQTRPTPKPHLERIPERWASPQTCRDTNRWSVTPWSKDRMMLAPTQKVPNFNIKSCSKEFEDALFYFWPFQLIKSKYNVCTMLFDCIVVFI